MVFPISSPTAASQQASTGPWSHPVPHSPTQPRPFDLDTVTQKNLTQLGLPAGKKERKTERKKREEDLEEAKAQMIRHASQIAAANRTCWPSPLWACIR